MEKILIYHVKEKDALKKLVSPMKIRLEEIEAADFNQTLQQLAAGQKNVLSVPFTGTCPSESLMIFCGVSEKHLDKLLFSMRQLQIPIDLKAVMTQTNQKWTIRMLFLELLKEKNKFEQKSFAFLDN